MKRDPRRRVPSAVIQSVLRKLHAINTLASGEIDEARRRIIVSNSESAYKELIGSVPWLTLQVTKRSDEVRSAARAIGLKLEHRGAPLSTALIESRMQRIAEAREFDESWTIPSYWLAEG